MIYSKMAKALDLFCGLGGWSDGLAMEGFQVLGVEINEEIARLYKHPCLVADVRELDGKQFRAFDVIVGSPPCRDFSIIAKTLGHTWKNPPNAENGLSTVKAFLRIVDEADPTFWLMENVPGLAPHLKIKPQVKTRLGQGMTRCFWGNFPPFLITRTMNKRISISDNGKLDWKGSSKLKTQIRAKIPLPIARALGHAMKTHLTIHNSL